MKIIIKTMVYILSVLQKTSMELVFDNKIVVSDTIDHLGYKELYFNNLPKNQYQFLWILIPGEISKFQSKSCLILKPSDRPDYELKVKIDQNAGCYQYISSGKNMFTYIFGTKNDFHANRFLIYSIRPNLLVDYYCLVWFVKLFSGSKTTKLNN